jgi:hypothetical protein
MLISAALKARLAQMSANTGLSMGQTCEALVEKGLAFDALVASVTNRPAGQVMLPARAWTQVELWAKHFNESPDHVVEYLIERCTAINDTFAKCDTTLEAVHDQQVDKARRALGFRAVDTAYGSVWIPPAYPIERLDVLKGHQPVIVDRGTPEGKS